MLTALFAVLMRDSLELPQLCTQLLGHDQAHGLQSAKQMALGTGIEPVFPA